MLPETNICSVQNFLRGNSGRLWLRTKVIKQYIRVKTKQKAKLEKEDKSMKCTTFR